MFIGDPGEIRTHDLQIRNLQFILLGCTQHYLFFFKINAFNLNLSSLSPNGFPFRGSYMVAKLPP
jgi:hypothetical protein